MECLILSQNTCWKQKIGYKMSGTLRGEIWGLSFAVAHSENWFLVHSRLLKLGYGPKIGQKWAKNGYFQNFEKSFKNYRYCLKETWKVLYWAKIPAESKKLDTTCPEPFGGKSGGWVLLYLIV